MHSAIGRKAKDKITGFTGVITGYCEYITGCGQFLVTPVVVKDNSRGEPVWFDEQRVELLKGKPVFLDNAATPGPDKPAPIR